MNPQKQGNLTITVSLLEKKAIKQFCEQNKLSESRYLYNLIQDHISNLVELYPHYNASGGKK